MRLSLFLTACIGWFLVAMPAQALSPCGNVVVDNAGLISSSDERRIEAAASGIESLGVTVRVRTSDYRAGDPYIKELGETSCNAWGGGEFVTVWIMNAPTKANRDLGIYRSPRIQGIITTDEAADIAREEIVPTMGSNPADGIISAFAEIESQLRPAFGPTTPTAQPSVVPRVSTQPTATPTVNDRVTATDDGLPFGYILGMLLAVMLALGVLYFVFLRYGRNRAAREEAKGVLAQCYGAFDLLNGPVDRLEKDYFGTEDEPKQAPNWANAGTFMRWRGRLRTIVDKADGANDHFLAVEQGLLNEARTIEEYNQFTQNLKDALASLKDAARELAELEEEIVHEHALSEELSHKFADADMAIAGHADSVTTIEKQGFKAAGIRSELDAAQAILAEARSSFAEKRHAEADEKLAEALAAAKKAADTAAALPALKAGLFKRRNELLSSQSNLLEEVPTVKAIYLDMQRRFAQGNLIDVKGNGSEAEKRLRNLDSAFASLKERLDAQEWEQTTAQIGAIEARLNEVQELLESVVELEQMLEQARADAPVERNEAERSIKLAREYLRQHPTHHTSDRENDLDEADRLVKESTIELMRTVRPNYPEAYKLAAKADDLADGVYDAAVEDQQELERRIARAERRRTEVQNRVAAAQRYGRLHSSDISRSTRQELDSLAMMLIMLQNAQHHDDILKLSKQLEDAVETAHERAVDEFETAEAEREEAARQSTTNYGYSNDDDETVSFDFGSSSGNETVSWGSSSGGGDETVGW